MNTTLPLAPGTETKAVVNENNIDRPVIGKKVMAAILVIVALFMYVTIFIKIVLVGP